MTDSRALASARKTATRARTVSKQTVRIMLYVQLLLLDLTALILGCVLTAKFLDFPVASALGLHLGYLVPPVYVLMALNNGAYSMQVLEDDTESMRRALMALVVAMVITLLFVFFLKSNVMATRLPFFVNTVASAGLLAVGRFAFRYHARSQHKGSLVDELLIVDDESYDGPLLRYTINARAEQIAPDLRSPDMINRVAHYMNGFDRVIICCPAERQHAWSLILKGANVQGEIVIERPLSLDAIGISRFASRDTLVVSRGPLSLANRAKKRMLDLAFTIPIIIALLPIFIVMAIIIKATSKGPVIFRQQRVGRGNRMFAIMKFRSMREELTDATGSRSASRDDDRVTKIGRFMRGTSIDELPQFFNVLIGDMSLVGPRPHALGSLAGNRSFWDVDEQYWVRHALKPGITGLAQVRGFRGATHHQEDLENRLRADLEYLDGWRLWRDVSILFATARVVVHNNAY
ncbi:MAG: exopolysaccharide biosynthesis polyprenyl glycosylphosphotransferase [Sphingobium sp.]